MQRNGGQEEHVKERIAKAVAMMGQVWGIRGWKEREAVERLQERYLRWVLGVERGTPRYMIREELQREKLKKAGKRAWAFEERLGELARLCWEESRGKMRGEGENLEGWMRERGQFFEDRGVELERWVWEELGERSRELQRMERWEKIRVTKYNMWYGWVKGEEVPEYLKKGWGRGDREGWLDLDWGMR
ncbi:hypothetical protein ALC57_13196 [Trachymyrmex cornetzi]|uniref:Uncharacterized protein n=1 Tax=Trachymyrmex cornetzi TaxID=471704 RepID=A0A151IZX0_9HYME|nr:hypothetical protein ALC57_13196 [Trachymyrmex cornetzi]